MADEPANPYAPPSFRAAARPRAGASPRTAELKKTPVLVIVLLNFVTSGWYAVYWYLSRRKALNELAERDALGLTSCVVAAALQGMNFLFALVGAPPTDSAASAAGAALLVQLAYGIAILVLAFRVKGILEESYAETLSGVLTFFLNLLYLQYKINRFGEPQPLADSGRILTGLRS